MEEAYDPFESYHSEADARPHLVFSKFWPEWSDADAGTVSGSVPLPSIPRLGEVWGRKVAEAEQGASSHCASPREDFDCELPSPSVSPGVWGAEWLGHSYTYSVTDAILAFYRETGWSTGENKNEEVHIQTKRNEKTGNLRRSSTVNFLPVPTSNTRPASPNTLSLSPLSPEFFPRERGFPQVKSRPHKNSPAVDFPKQSTYPMISGGSMKSSSSPVYMPGLNSEFTRYNSPHNFVECDVCKKKFRSQARFRCHLLQDTVTGASICPYTGIQLSSPVHLEHSLTQPSIPTPASRFISMCGA